jgi:hypothetical protein
MAVRLLANVVVAVDLVTAEAENPRKRCASTHTQPGREFSPVAISCPWRAFLTTFQGQFTLTGS